MSGYLLLRAGAPMAAMGARTAAQMALRQYVLGLGTAGKVAIGATTSATIAALVAYFVGRSNGRTAEGRDVVAQVLAVFGRKPKDKKTADAAREFLRNLGERSKAHHKTNMKELELRLDKWLNSPEGKKSPLEEILATLDPQLAAILATAGAKGKKSSPKEDVPPKKK